MHQQHELSILRTQRASRRRTEGWAMPWLAVALVALQLTVPTVSLSLPTEGKVVAGQATIQQTTPKSLSIQQATDKAILNWNSFSIAANEAVRFYQPSIQSIALNRITGIDPSVILGSLQANGRIFLINPNGILFGAGAQINVGGLIASTLQIQDADFMAGRYLFTQDPLKGLRAIINKGEIRVSDQGFVYLVAPGVANDGLIMANLGSVFLGSSQKATLDLMGDGLINYVLSDKVASQVLDHEGKPLTSALSNSGVIQANGGTVILSAKASGDIFDSVINQSGIIRAQSLVDRGGVIRLEGGDPVQNNGVLGWQQHLGEVKNADGRVLNTGTLDVSAAEAGAAQGEVTMSGQMVGIAGSILARGADQASGGKILATSSEKTIVATDAVIDTSGVGNSSAGNTVIWSDKTTAFRGTILAKGGETGGNGGQIEVSGHELLEFTGRVNALAPFGSAGTLLLDPRNITIATAGGVAYNPGVNNLFANTPAADVTITPASINAAAANVILQANNDITVTNAISTTNAGVGIAMQAGRDINVNANVSTNNGAISLTSNDPGAQVANRQAGTGNINMAAGTTLNAGNQAIALTIGNLVGGTPGSITANGLTTAGGNILLNSANSITLNGAITAGAGIVRMLASNGTISQPGGSITAGSLGVRATGAITLNQLANNVTTLAGAVTGAGNAFQYTDANGLSVGSVAASGAFPVTTGVSTNNGPVTLTATTGGITVTNTAAAADVTAGTSTLALNANGANQALTIAAGANVTGTGGVTYTADQMALTGTTTVTAAIGTLQPFSAGRLVDLGGADSATTLGLTSAELNSVTAGTLRVGSLTGGNLNVSAAIAPAGTTTLSLLSGGTMTQAAAGTITETNLRLSSVGSITLDLGLAPTSTSATTNAVTTLAANVTGPGSTLSFRGSGGAAGLTAGTVDGVAGVTTNNGAVAIAAAGGGSADSLTVNQAIASNGGSIALASHDHMTLNANVNAGAGIVTVNSNTDLGNIGNFVMAAGTSITTTNTSANAVQITLNNSDTATANATLNNITTGSGGTITVTAAPRVGTGGSIAQLAGGLLNAGTGTVALSTQTGVATGIGTAANPIATTAGTVTASAGNNGVFIRETDGANFTATATNAGQLYLGTQSGTLTVNGATSTGSGNVTLDGGATGNIAVNNTVTTTGTVRIIAPGGAVSEGGAGAINAASLGVRALGPVNLNGNNNVTTVAGNVTGVGNGFSYNDINAVTVGSVAAAAAPPVAFAVTDGISTNNGAVTVTTTNGALTVSNTAAAIDVNAGTSTVSLTAGGANQLLTVAATANVTGTGGVIYTADNMTLTGTTTATGAVATLQPNTAGQLVNLGGADAAGTLGLTSAELNTVTAGTLRVGRANSGNLSISAAIAPTGTNTLSLLSGGSVTQTAAITETNLRVSAVGPVTLTSAANDVTTVAANVTGSGFSYTDANGFTVGTVDGVSGVTAAGNVGLTSQAGGGVTVTDGITTTNNGTVTLTNAGTLALNANITADGAVLQNGAGAVTTGGAGTRTITTTGDNVTINQAVSLGSDLTVDSQSAVAGNVTFNNTINGANNLTVNTGGTTTFAGAVGGTTALTSVTTNAAGTTALNGGAVTTTGNQTFNDAVTLGANTALNAGAGNITFGNTINGAQSLTANSTGTTTFLGAIGGTTPLTSVSTNAGGITDLNGGTVTTTGSQTYNDVVRLSANTTLNAGVGNITFGNHLDSTTGNNFSLAANSTGTTTFGAAVGGIDALSSVTTNAGGTTAINGGSVTTTGSQTFNDAVVLGANTTLNAGAGSITFGNTLNGAFSLAANSTGTTTFGGAVGTTDALSTITTDAGGTTILNGGSVTTTGNQTFNDAVSLGANTALNAGAGSISFDNTLNGAFSLTANSTGLTTFGGAVGNLTPLATVTTNVGGTTAINGGAVSTTGNQTYGDNVTMNQATTLTSTGGAVAFGGNATNTAAGSAITVDAPTINLTGGTTVATTGNGLINFFTDTLNPNGANINAGTGTFTLAPNVLTKTIEFGDVNTARVTDVYYGSNFGSVTAGSFTIGRPTHTGNIFVTGVAAAPSAMNIVNGGAGAVTFENAPYVSGNQNFGAASGSGGINLGTDLTIGTGTLRLTSAGAITQTSGSIIANILGAAAATGIALAQPTNNVTTLAAQTTTGNLAFSDTNGFTIGSVGATADGFHPAITGLTANAGDITLQSGGAATQTAAITASGLSLQGAGPYTLTNAGNDVTSLAANTTGAVQYRDATDVTVGTVGAVTGITSGGNDVALQTGGALTINQAINTGAGNLGLVAGNTITQGAGGPVTASALSATTLNNAGAPITLDNVANEVTTLTLQARNAADNADAAGALTYRDATGVDVAGARTTSSLTLTTNGAITDSGALVVGGTTTLAAGAGNNISLDTATNNFGTLAVTSGNNVALVDANAIDLGTSNVSGALNVTAGGAITDSGNLLVAGTTTLAAGVANDITLNSAGNNFSTVAITSGNNVALVDVNAINLGTSTVANDLSVTAGGLISQSGSLTVPGTATFDTAAAVALGTVNLANSGTLTLGDSTVGGNLTATTTAGDITLPAGQTMTVAGDTSLIPAGTVNLLGTTRIGGSQSYVGGTGSTFILGADTNLNVLPLPGTGNITVNTTGTTATFAGAPILPTAINLNNAGNLFGGTVRVTTASPAFTGATANTYNLTQSAAVNLNVGQTLNVTDLGGTAGKRGNITLTNPANSFETVNFTGGNIAWAETGPVSIGATGVSANAGTTSTGTLSITSTGAITQVGPVTAPATTTLAAGAGNDIALTNAANNFSNVSIVSGNNVALTDTNALDLGASAVSGNLIVATSGPITDSGALVVAGTTTLASGAANNITLDSAANNFSTVVITSGNNVTLTDVNALDLGASTVTNTLTLTTGGALTQSGAIVAPNLAVTSSGPVTLTNPANDVDTLAAQVIGPGNGFQFADADGLTVGTVGALAGITAAGNVALTTANGGGLTVDQPITTTNSGTLTLSNDGVLALNADLTADGAISQNGAGAITTTGTRTITTTDDAVSILRGTTLGGDLTVNAGTGPVTSSTIDGGTNLTVNSTGATTFLGAIGGTTPLANVTTNAGGTTDLNGGSVTTTGAQTYNDAVLLSTDTTLTAGAGNITFGNQLNSTAGNTFNLAANSTGTTTFNGAVGTADALSSLTTNAGGTTALNGGSVTTTGAQTYNDAVTLGAGTTVSSAGNGAITFGNTVNGAQSLTVNTGGATIFAGVIGGTTPLTSVTTDQPGTVSVASATTTGAQTYNENTVTLNGTYTTINEAFTAGTTAAAITLNGDTTVSTGTGAITFNGAVDGAQNLTANSTGATTFTGAIGNTTPLTSLTTNAGGTTALNGGSVTTTGNQTYGDAVTMNQATTLTSTGGTVQFDNTVTNSAAGAGVTVDAPTITLNAATTVETNNGNINFFTDTLNTNGASINAGTGAFAVAPNTVTKTIEFGDVDTARATDVYYSSNFGSIVAGSFTIGRPTQTGDIFVTGVTNLTTPLTVINGGTGAVRVENAPLTSPNNSNVGLVSGSGGTTLAADVNVGTGTVRITTTGAITQTGGALTADTLALSAGNGITVAQAGNDVNTLAAQTTAGGISFRDSDGFVIGSIGASLDGLHPAIAGLTANAGNVALQSGGTVTQTAAITASGLSLQGAGPYTLTNAGNDVTSLAANTTGAVQYRDATDVTVGTVGAVTGITSGGNDVALQTGGALTINQAINTGAGNLGLNAGGAVTQGAAGPITANGLNLQGAGPYQLTNAANDVTILGANVTGLLEYRDANALVIGIVPAVGTLVPTVTGITSGNNDVALQTGGALAINQAINAGSGDLGVLANGSVTQTAAITANELNLQGTGPFTLTNANNDVNTLGANTTGTIQLRDVDDVTVGNVAAVGTLLPAVSGITTTNADVALQTGGALTLNQSISVGNANVGLNSAGPVTQGAAGNILASGLNLQGAGPVTLTNATNDVTTLGANTTGPVDYRDANALTIGSVAAVGALVPAVSGITTGGNDAALSTGGALTINQAVNTGAGNLGLNAGGAVTQGAAGTITANGLNLQGAGPYQLTNAGNDVTTLGANTTGVVEYRDANSLIVGSVPAVGTLVPAVSGITSGNNDVALQTGGALTINQAINLGTGDLGLSATGAITQGLAGTITANELNLQGTGPVTLTNAGNDVNVLGASLTGPLEFRDLDGLTIGSVAAVGTLLPAISGITSGNNDVALQTGGALAINQAINTGTGNLGLSANGAVTQGAAGTITANNLNLQGAGPYDLTNPNNDMNVVGANTTGAVFLRDVNSLTVGSVPAVGTLPAVSGITSGNNDVALVTGGALTINNQINAGTGNVGLQSSGAVTQGPAGNILGNNLNLQGSGPFTLTNPGNDVATIGASTTGSVQYRDANSLTVGSVPAVGPLAAVTGITSGNNDVALQTGGALTINQAITTGNANLGLSANGPVTQGAAGTIAANQLNLQGSGPYALTNGGNDVNVVGANTTGAVQVNDANNMTVGAVAAVGSLPAVSGITSGNSDVALVTAGTLTLANSVNAGTGNIGLQAGGAVTQGAVGNLLGNNLNLQGTGPFVLTNAANDVNTVGANTTGSVQITDANSLTVGSVPAVGTLPAVTGITTNNNDVALITGGALTLNNQVNAGTANIGLQSAGGVTQAAPLTANNLNLQGSGAVTLTNAGNNVNVLGANVTGPLQYTDANGLTVGSVPAVGTIPAINGITSGNNDVALITGGALTLNQSVNAGTGNLGLSSNGNVTQGGAGTITANNLNLQGNGPYTLTNPSNDVATLGGSTAGNVQYTDANALTLGAVPAVGTLPAAGGLTSTGGNITVSNNTGDLTLASVNAPTGSVNLTATGGSILGSGPGPNLTAGGNSTLQAPTGVVGTQAAPINVLVNGGTLSIRAGTQLAGISGFLTGTVSPVNSLTLLAPLPPGTVCFNACPGGGTGGIGGPVGLVGINGFSTFGYLNRDVIVPTYYLDPSGATQITQVASEYVPGAVLAASDVNLTGDQEGVAQGAPGGGILTAPTEGGDPEAPNAGAGGACRQRDEMKKGLPDDQKGSASENRCEEPGTAK